MRSELELRALIARVTLVRPAIPTEIGLRADMTTEGPMSYALAVRTVVPDTDTGGTATITHYLPLDASLADDEVIAFVRAAVRAIWLHEADEALHVDGARRWDPHEPIPGTRMRSRGTVYDLEATRT